MCVCINTVRVYFLLIEKIPERKQFEAEDEISFIVESGHETAFKLAPFRYMSQMRSTKAGYQTSRRMSVIFFSLNVFLAVLLLFL